MKSMNWIQEGARKFQTPFYVLDTDVFTEQMLRIQKELKPIQICYAMKTNPFLTKIASQTAERIEVCSTGEFYICEELGIPVEKLLISGVLKKHEDLEYILEKTRGRCLYTAESPSQLRQLAEWAGEHETVVRVYPRLTSGNQFGMDEQTILELFANYKDNKWISLEGIHFFSGTQTRSGDVIKKELSYLDDFFEKIEEDTGCAVRSLEYGPGVPAEYFEGVKKPKEPQKYLDALSEAAGEMRWKGSVTVEMGRGFAADCGYYVTRVCDVKSSREINYCIVDGGIHQLQYDGQIRGIYLPKVTQLVARHDYCVKENTEEAKIKNWKICGSLCTGNDVLINEMPAEEIEEEDILVFHKTGAYSMMEGAALFLSHELPAIMLHDQSGWFTARERRETYQFNMFV